MKNIELGNLFCRFPRSNYSETLIEQLGVSINTVGVLLRPLIIQALQVEEFEGAVYEVVDGAIFYYAAVYANDNNILFSHVPCWVLADAKDLEFVLEQFEYLTSIDCSIAEIDFTLPILGSCS